VSGKVSITPTKFSLSCTPPSVRSNNQSQVPQVFSTSSLCNLYCARIADLNIPFIFRFQSPRSSRYSLEHSYTNSYEVEGTLPFSQPKRRKDKRKQGSSVPQTGFHIRKEGFDTGGSPHPASAPPIGSSARQRVPLPCDSKLAPVGEVNSSPSKPGLLSRTFSSGLVPNTNHDAIKVRP
jgi:hypothetical protein